jgi:hypothetical protein
VSFFRPQIGHDCDDYFFPFISQIVSARSSLRVESRKVQAIVDGPNLPGPDAIAFDDLFFDRFSIGDHASRKTIGPPFNHPLRRCLGQRFLASASHDNRHAGYSSERDGEHIGVEIKTLYNLNMRPPEKDEKSPSLAERRRIKKPAQWKCPDLPTTTGQFFKERSVLLKTCQDGLKPGPIQPLEQFHGLAFRSADPKTIGKY